MPTHGHASRFNSLSYAAVDERRLDAVLLMPGPATSPFSARSGRRVNGAGLAVAVSGSPENWSVAPGAGVIFDANYATQGPWRFEIPAQVSGSMGTRPATGQSRIDLLVVRILDTDVIGSGTRDVIVERVVGTPGTSPSAPTLPALSYLVATLTVPNSGSVTIAPNQAVVVAAGGILPVATTAERDALVTAGIAYRGLVVDNAQVAKLQRYDGSAWKTLVEDDSTGWMSLPLASGFTGLLLLKAAQREVTIEGTVNGNFPTSPLNTTVTAASAIPSQYRPPQPVGMSSYRPGVVLLSGNPAANVLAQAAGHITVSNRTGANITGGSADINIRYGLDLPA